MSERLTRPRVPGDYQKSGINIVKRQVRARVRRGRDVLDKRTRLGRALAEWRAEVAVDMGGLDNLSAAQMALLDIAARTRLLLDSVDAFILRQPSPVNRRSRALLPVVVQRQALADSLLRTLTALGLERRLRQVPPLAEYLRERKAASEAVVSGRVAETLQEASEKVRTASDSSGMSNGEGRPHSGARGGAVALDGDALAAPPLALREENQSR